MFLKTVRPKFGRWKRKNFVVIACSVVITTQINIFLYPFLHFPDDKHFVF